MSPKFLDKLKPYFKTRPRSPTAKQPAAARTAPPSVPTQTALGSPQPAQAPTQVVSPAPKSRRARRREQKHAKRRRRRSAAQPAGELTARRNQLARRFAELQFDLGGLAYEMAIRGSLRPEVLTRRAAGLQAVEAQLSATENAIRSGASGFAGTCARCSTPYVAGAIFCSSCGNRLAATPQPATPKSREEQKPSEPQTASPPAPQQASPARPAGADTPPAAQPQATDPAKGARR